MKKYKVPIIVLCIVGVLGIVLLCASKLVGVSYSSEEYVAEKELGSEEDEINAPEVDDGFSMEYSEVSGGLVDKVTQMYNADRVENDLDRFLDNSDLSVEDINSLKDTISEIEEGSEEYLSKLPNKPSEVSGDPVYYNIEDTPNLTAKQLLNDGDYAIIESSLSVLGLFGGNRVLYSYGFPESSLYIVVDYSDTDFVKDTNEVWRIGDIKDIGLFSKSSTYQDMGTYQIIYTKG